MNGSYVSIDINRALILEYGDVIVDFCPMLLSYAFWYPHDVSAFLFLQFQVRIEHSIMELLQESVDV